MQQSKYRILGLVGQGQFGRVFCAVCRQTGELVALKDLERQRFPTKRFLRELRFLVSLQHPNIVAYQAMDHYQTRRCLVMDYCEGGTLRDLMELEGQLSLVQRLKLIADILMGLEHAHSHDIVHCDLKPENILLNLESGGWVARIADFGIARLSQEIGSADQVGGTGSPAYMAPERLYGQYSYASDLYAVGVLLFELVVGQRPFSGPPAALMFAHLNQPVEIPEVVPFLLRSTILRALQKLPNQRFASAGEMLKSIRLATEVLAVTQLPTPLVSVPTLATSPCPGEKIRKEPLPAPVTWIAVESQRVYLGMTNRIRCQTYSDSVLTELVHQWQVLSAKPLEEFSLRPQGCFAVARSRRNSVADYSLYCLPRTLNLSNLEADARFQEPLERFALLSLQSENLVSAIDPQGRWIAIAQATGSTFTQVLSESTSYPATFQVLKLPSLQPVKPPVSCLLPSQLIFLDSRYGLALFPAEKAKETLENGAVLQIFTRRGNFAGCLSLPSMRQVTPSATSPYRLLAIEQCEPALGLLFDLKPFKVTRIALDINPAFVIATKWGYVLADCHRQLVLLDQDGHTLSKFELTDTSTEMDVSIPNGVLHIAPSPAITAIPHSRMEDVSHSNENRYNSQITAIAAFAEYGLLIATWSDECGFLYTVDLRTTVTTYESMKIQRQASTVNPYP